MKTYTPNPIDTTTIELPDSLLLLLECLAENAHEVWSARRIKDGWTSGPQRYDAKKQTPCLIPYDQMSEFEKKEELFLP